MGDGVELPADTQAELDAALAAVLPGAVETKPVESAQAAGSEAATAEGEPKPEGEVKPKAEAKPKAEEKPKPETPAGKLALQLNAQRKALETQARAQKATAVDLERRGAEVERVHTQLSAEMRAAQEDPIAWLGKRFGLTPNDIAERLLKGTSGPIETQRKAASPELEELRNELKALRTERQQERQSAAQAQAHRDFVSTARGDESRWPLASKWSEARLIAKGEELTRDVKAGQGVTFADILDKIEEELGEVASLSGGKPAQAAKPSGKAKGKQAAPTLAAGPTTDGGNGGSDEEPDIMAMGDDERFAYLGRVLKKQFNGAGARN